MALLDKDGLPVDDPTTNAHGLYLFDRLQPSEYTVIFSCLLAMLLPNSAMAA